MELWKDKLLPDQENKKEDKTNEQKEVEGFLHTGYRLLSLVSFQLEQDLLLVAAHTGKHVQHESDQKE